MDSVFLDKHHSTSILYFNSNLLKQPEHTLLSFVSPTCSPCSTCYQLVLMYSNVFHEHAPKTADTVGEPGR